MSETELKFVKSIMGTTGVQGIYLDQSSKPMFVGVRRDGKTCWWPGETLAMALARARAGVLGATAEVTP